MKINNIPIIDIFAGPGGLGEGFSSLKKRKTSPFNIKLSIEMEHDAHQTLSLRSFFRKFPKGKVPLKYYQFVQQNRIKNLDDLFKYYPELTAEVQREVKKAELGKYPDESTIDLWN